MNRFLSYTTCFLAVFLTMIVADVKTLHAQTSAEGDAFTVRNIKIDVTADSAKDARDKAFRQAQEKSLPILFKQLADAGYDTQALKQANAKEIANAVKDFEIANEKISAVRYKGDFVFRYDEQILSQYFYASTYNPQDNMYEPTTYNPQRGGVAPQGVQSNKDRVLVLPFFQVGNGQTALWEGNNPWKSLWKKKATRTIFAPIGDLADIRDITDAQALTYDPEKLARMSTRYTADRVIVLIGLHEGAAMPTSSTLPANGTFRVSIYDTARGRPEFLSDVVLNEQNYRTFDEVLYAGYNRSMEVIYGLQPIRAIGNDNYQEYSPTVTEQAVQYERPANNGSQSSFQARIEYTSMQEWIKAQKTLRSVRGVSTIDVLSLTPRQAEMTIHYQGNFDDVATAMTQTGYNIQPTSKMGRYVIYSSRHSAYNENGGIVYR